MNIDLKKILSEANFAPSGDNCQPWKFKIFPDRLEMFNLPEKDQSVYNFRQQASHISHGAFIENICIIASANRLSTKVDLFPNQNNQNHVATITFVDSETVVDNLFPFINKRCTNRKLYKTEALKRDQATTFSNISVDSFVGSVCLIEQEKNIKDLAGILSINEKIVLQNIYLHKFLFENIVWSNTESLANRDKMFIKTLEMNPFQEFIFKLCKNWSIMNYLNKFGIAKFIAKENAKIYAQSSAFGAILAPSNHPKDFVNGGRLLQRAWLTATSLNLSFQPLAGIVLLYQKILAKQTSELSTEHVSDILIAYNKLKDIVKKENKNILFMFRVGESKEPSALTPKLPVEKIIVA